MDFKVIDNFLSDFDYQLALSIVEDDNTTWRCGEVVFEELLKCPIQFNRQFSHFIHVEDKSTMYYLVLLPILKILNIKDEDIIRAKINNNLATENIIEHGFHIDTEIKSKTIIYYFNTNNGYTLFENGNKVESISNRLIIFDSSMHHTGTTCTNKSNRYVLNINYHE